MDKLTFSKSVSSLALSMFLSLTELLPEINIDQDENVVDYLLQTARRGVTEDNPLLGAIGVLENNAIDDFEEKIVTRIHQKAMIREIMDFWNHSLSSEDHLIMTSRSSVNPPMTFMEICLRLGPGWTESAVRQRHHRVLQRTRQYLRQRSLLDDQN